MCDEELFAGQADRLARRRRVMIFQSEGEDSVRDAAAELLAMLGSLGLRRFDLGGLSMGAAIAMAGAARCPSAVKRLVLMGARHEGDTEEGRAARQQMIHSLEEGRLEEVMDTFLPRLLAEQGLRDLGDNVRHMFRRLGAGIFLRQLRMLLTREDMSETLRAFEGEALVLCGARDTITPPALHQTMAALIPASRLVIVPGNCGHLVSLESPRAVADALEDFLGAS